MNHPSVTIVVGIGALVQVVGASAQRRVRLGPAKHPGRGGTVVSRNPCTRDDCGGLWYVRLDATGRARERVETFWGDELVITG